MPAAAVIQRTFGNTIDVYYLADEVHSLVGTDAVVELIPAVSVISSSNTESSYLEYREN